MDEMALPMTEEPIAPAPPADKPIGKPEEPVGNPTDLAEMANRLYEAATKLQRDAEALMKAAQKESEEPLEKASSDKMTPEESEAAIKAILGI